MAALIAVSVIRRIYDTRIFGTVRVKAGRTQATRASTQPVLKLNARLGMCRESVEEGRVSALVAPGRLRAQLGAAIGTLGVQRKRRHQVTGAAAVSI